MTVPVDFVVLGAGRCGTTALHTLLGRHPGIAMCARKSPNHFAAHLDQPAWETPAAVAMARHWVGDPGRYAALFGHARPGQRRGEVSPVYLQATDVAERLHRAAPDARLVAILRDPAERAHAHFLGRRRDGIENRSSVGRWLDEMEGVPLPDEVAFGHYVGIGRYHHFLAPYVRRFGRDRLLVLFHDDLVDRPADVMAQLFGFLGVDPGFRPTDPGRPNRSGEIRDPRLRRLWTSTTGARTRLRPLLPARLRDAVGRRVLRDLEREPLDAEVRARIVALLADDIRRLESLVDRDLTAWRS